MTQKFNIEPNRFHSKSLAPAFVLGDIDYALLTDDTDLLNAVLAWREAFMTVAEWREHCDKHMVAYYEDEECPRCKEEQ
jgi:hypothetical protein